MPRNKPKVSKKTESSYFISASLAGNNLSALFWFTQSGLAAGEEFFYFFIHRFQIEIPLRHGDLYPCLPKGLNHGDREPALGIEISLDRRPNTHLEIERAVAKALEHDRGSRLSEHIGVRGSNGEQNLHHFLQIGAIGNGYSYINPAPWVRQRPVHQFF